MQSSSLYNEKELLFRIAQGDEKAFAAIVDQHWPRIYTVSLTFIKSTHTAQDIVQDVFLKVWEKRESLPGIDNFSGWLFIIARNIIISSLRKKQPVFIPDIYRPEQQEDSEAVPEQILGLKQLNELVEEGVKLLPEQQRRIYKMSRVEGLNHDEICNELGLARSSVKNSLVKALNFLRQYIRERTDPFILILAGLYMWL